MKYGDAPENLGIINPAEPGSPREFMHYLYMPIKLPGTQTLTLDHRLEHHFTQQLRKISSDFVGKDGLDRFMVSYMYITAKYGYCDGKQTLNRPGWHTPETRCWI